MLGPVQIRKVGLVALARVDDRQAGGAEGFDQSANRRHDLLQEAHVVAQSGAEAARLDKIALHVDHDQRSVRRVEGEIERLCLDRLHQCPAIARPMAPTSAWVASISCASLPSNITTMRSESWRISSRSSLTRRTAAPRLRVCRMRARISATAAKSRPKQGLATINRSPSLDSSRASTARCTLPPERALIGASGP